MGLKTKIEWTEASWNPTTGCSKISAGCKNCYAERMAIRLKAMGQYNYRNGFELTVHEHMLNMPLKWKKPQIIFVNSMSDLFHIDVPADFITKVFQTMGQAKQHQFQLLTKRSDRLLKLNNSIQWQPNVWAGVTVENEECIYRINDLRETGAKIKFLSIEPLLGPLPRLNLEKIDWVIVGGESGPYARRVEREWVIDIKNQCKEFHVPFFFKQWGGTNKKKAGRLLEGKTWSERPLAIEQFKMIPETGYLIH